jgi:hypothetical protein
VRVTVAVPLLGADDAVAARRDAWLDGFGDRVDWEWDVVFVEGGWVSDPAWERELRGRGTQPIRVVRATRPGRGRALKDVWMSSSSELVACVDSGLRTNAARLRTLLRPLKAGKRIWWLVRGWRCHLPDCETGYSRGGAWLAEALTQWTTGSRLHDHRSGVVAMTATAVRGLVPHVRSTRDLFEMELLLWPSDLAGGFWKFRCFQPRSPRFIPGCCGSLPVFCGTMV